jgi:hypothetical protein
MYFAHYNQFYMFSSSPKNIKIIYREYKDWNWNWELELDWD